MLETYTKADGTALKAEDFTNSKDTFIDLKTKAEPDTNFACFVPKDVRLTVNTAWGDVLHVNDPVSEHGYGDYLVCPNKDGKPDFSDVWVVNGVNVDILSLVPEMHNSGAVPSYSGSGSGFSGAPASSYTDVSSGQVTKLSE